MSGRWQGEKITEKHIRQAAKHWEKNPGALGFGPSTKYDVYIDGKPFPPKAISALAYQSATKQTLEPKDFTGTFDGYWHGILKKFFPIWPKSSVFTKDQDVEAMSQNISALSYEQLAKLAAETASEKPHREDATRSVFQRSIYVRRAALLRANGICQKCNSDAPFKKKSTGEPYLEVHHVKPLSWGGADSLDNVIAVCPNCHAEIHDEIKLNQTEE